VQDRNQLALRSLDRLQANHREQHRKQGDTMKSANRARLLLLAAFFLLLSAFGLGLPAMQEKAKDSSEAANRLRQFAKHQSMRAKSPFKDIKWTQVGPMRPSGRMTDVEVHPSEPKVIYAAAAQGGVWKSTDDGVNWNPIFDDYPTGSIGDIAIAPSNPKIVWVGTGEANIFRSSQAGIGIFKSIDAGQHFTYMGLADTQHIARIVVHPTNPDIVYVASAGHEYTFSPDRGVYKTTDGGKSWKKVFYKNEKTGVIDLAMDPGNPEILYAGTAQRLRYRWNDPIESVESGIYKTIDGGKTWTALANGLPDFSKGECERVGISVCLTKPNIVYAVINQQPKETARQGAYLYRSDDKGESWKLVEGNDKIRGSFAYGWVFGQVRVDPNDPNVVYVMGLNYLRSKDGGKTWENLKENHVDNHGMWIDPKDSNHILVVNDGGIAISHDGLATFQHPVNIPIGHLFTMAVSQTKGKFWAYSNVQDTGGWRGEIDMTAGRDHITSKEWESSIGDEAGRHAVNPIDPNVVYYVTRYGGGPYVMDYTKAAEAQAQAQALAQAQAAAQGQAQGQASGQAQGQARGQVQGGRGGRAGQTTIAPDFGTDKKRSQWVSPIIVSPHDPNRILYGAQFVFLTNDQGKTWRKISPDLTNFDPAKQGNIPYSTVWSISESPLKKGLIYAGTDDGNIHVTKDEGGNWEKITKGLPPERFIASIEASRFDEGTVYIVVNGRRHNDFNPYLFKSKDYGKSWINIATSVPGGVANVVKEDPTNKNILYLGTDLGVYVTTDGGEKWEVLGTGLPTAYVFDMALQTAENVLVIGTHGRSCWVADILPVRAAAKK
jgi:photosystem II stability/assembly factor-like uncharacterized protein